MVATHVMTGQGCLVQCVPDGEGYRGGRGCELPRAGGFEVFVPFRKFAAEVATLLFQLGGAACERLDVGRGAEAGCFPSRLAQSLGHAPFEPGDVCGQSPIAGRKVRDIGQQRRAADLRSGSRAGQGLARAGDGGCVRITVAVNQAAVNAGGTGYR